MFFYGKYFDNLKKTKFKNNKVASMGVDFLEILIDAVLIISIFYILFDNRLVPTGSMIPNVQINDHVFFEKPSIYLNSINRGDVVLFDATAVAPKNDETKIKANILHKLMGVKSDEIDYLKRVIAVGGDKISITNGKVFINEKEYIPNYKVVKGDTYSTQKTVTVPDGYVFVMGDNRVESYDGRFWGLYDKRVAKNKANGFKYVDGLTFVSKDKIKAKALFDYNIKKFKFKSLR